MPKFYIALVFIAFGLLCFFVVVRAETNIDSVYKWAWNDLTGWIDHYSSDTVFITESGPDTKIEGYAVSNLGEIAFECETSPNPPADCNLFPDWETKVNANSGVISGWAWNDRVGWISLNCENLGVCVLSNYKVMIDADGYFEGFAWNDIVGWISFNCGDPGVCLSSDYKVKTTWEARGDSGYLISSIFDTGREGGAALNSIIRQGSDPAYTNVRAQIASSPNESGPWDFEDFKGPGCTAAEADAYILPQNTSVAFNPLCQGINDRYFRYKVILETDPSKTVTPKVDDIILNWSR